MQGNQEVQTPPAYNRPGPIKASSLSETNAHGRQWRRRMKRTRSAPDCKHGLGTKIKIGLCAMDKKAQSKPMCEIIARLLAGREFEVVPFGDKVIIDEPIESWPLCDVMLSWHSEGFPLHKAQAYVELRRPFLINDVHMQDVLLDRRRVYKTLMDNNIPVPRHIMVNREAPPPPADDELTTSSSSAGSTPRATSPQPLEQAEDSPTSQQSNSRSSSQQPRVVEGSGGTLVSQQSYSSCQSTSHPAGTIATATNSARSSCGGSVVGITLPDPPGFCEGEDWVELNGVRIDKPFVEKPASGEDHNIYIYYPHSMGGGVKRLFRKVDNKSADYDPHHPGIVRRDGSYIYEEFLTTGGTDVKVYTVGPRYAHAEARKSPVVDGKVNRTPDGKEVRFPVLLSPQEKEIARMVCLAFGQRVCGFDLLRSETGRSYVCDVNGWSFVKNSKKYYDDAAGILRSIILSQLAPHRLSVAPEPPVPLAGLLEEAIAAGSTPGPGTSPGMTGTQHDSTGSCSDDLASPQTNHEGFVACDVESSDMSAFMREASSLQDLTSLDGAYDEDGGGTDDSSSTSGTAEKPWLELRCVLAVVRHGDRTPKQKMKVTVTQKPLLDLFQKYKDSKGKQAKLKSPGQLQELLDVTRQLLADMEAKSAAAAASGKAGAPGSEEERAQELHEEQREKLRIVRTVLEQGGTFSGINRKVQLKPTQWSKKPKQQPASVIAADGNTAVSQQDGGNQGPPPDDKPAQQVLATPKQKRVSSSGGADNPEKGDKPAKDDDQPVVTELLLILKYGGVLTHAGRTQAEELGKAFRMIMYPRYGPAGGGLLRLHSTYRHDMKIYSSDEGRVQMSAAAFIKGLLDLEGSSLTPILVSLVTKNASMLDAFGKGASDDILATKNTLYQHLTWDPEKSISLCSRLALPLSTPANSSPPLSPKRQGTTIASDSFGMEFTDKGLPPAPHLSGSRRSQLGQQHSNEQQQQQQPSSSSSGLNPLSTSSAVAAGLPTSSSCLDLLQQGRMATGSPKVASLSKPPHGPAAPDSSSSSTSVGTTAVHQLQQQDQLRRAVSAGGLAGSPGGSGPVTPVVAVAGSQSQLSLSKLGSTSWSQRQAEARAAALSGIKWMPEKPLPLLYRMVELMKVLVDQLREKCLEERLDLAGPAAASAAAAAGAGSSSSSSSSAYSSLTTAPEDWRLDPAKPCSAERLLLMFDRWRKLLKSFYNEKKQQFDISKVPDIYDSAKFDAIHNSHLQLTPLKELYEVSRQLASVVVPHEYGLDGPGKLLIGSKICAELLGKLLCDLDSMKEESIITAAIEAETAAKRAAAAEKAAAGGVSRSSRGRPSSHQSLIDGRYDNFDAEFGQMSLEDERMRPAARSPSYAGYTSFGRAAPTDAAAADSGSASALLERHYASDVATLASGVSAEQEDREQEQAEKETLHRLCPTYASDVNSPLRHVRTRIYFTSESHIHSLINVLRYCHLPSPPGTFAAASSVISSSTGGGNIAGHSTPVGGITPAPSVAAAMAATMHRGSVSSSPPPSSPPVTATAAATAAATADGTVAAAAAVATDKTTSSSSMTKSAFASASGAAAASAAGGADVAAAAAVAAAPGGIACAASGSGTAVAAAAAGGDAGSGTQPLITPEAQELLDNTTEFDYLTHIVFRMYENKQVPVDSPDRFLVEIQFSNGANYDPTTVIPLHDNHVLPTQPRKLLTTPPGVPLQTLTELVRKYARGKNTPSNYQLQVALRAPVSAMNSHAPSKLPTPGVSRQPSGGALPAPAAAALLAVGPGATSSAPLPANVVADIAKMATVAATTSPAGQ